MKLPEEIVIRPRSRGIAAQISEIGKARFMLWNLIKSAALLPYADLALGIFWTFARPLIFVAVIVFIRNKSNAQMGETVPYALYVFGGLILWWYFVDATKQSSRSLYRYRGLLTKVYYPRLITPLVPVIARLFDLGLQLFAIIPLMLYFERLPNWHIFMMPLLVVHVAFLALGFGFLFSVLSAAIKDFERMLDFALYLAFFMSPVIFSLRIVPTEYRQAYAFFNPMVGPLEVFRNVLFGGESVDYAVWGLSALSTLFVTALGVLIFLRYEERLAEMVS